MEIPGHKRFQRPEENRTTGKFAAGREIWKDGAFRNI